MGETNIWNLGINYGWGPVLPLFSYLYTDRPIYRPGDTVYFKGILRENNYGRYALPAEQSLTCSLRNLFLLFTESGLEDTISVDVNAEGLFWGEFVLPKMRRLGTYNSLSHQDNRALFVLSRWPNIASRNFRSR